MTLDFVATDDATGVSRVEIDYQDALEGAHSAELYTPIPSSADLTIGPNWPHGTYSIYRIVVQDGAGNQADYRPDGHIYKYPA